MPNIYTHVVFQIINEQMINGGYHTIYNLDGSVVDSASGLLQNTGIQQGYYFVNQVYSWRLICNPNCQNRFVPNFDLTTQITDALAFCNAVNNAIPILGKNAELYRGYAQVVPTGGTNGQGLVLWTVDGQRSDKGNFGGDITPYIPQGYLVVDHQPFTISGTNVLMMDFPPLNPQITITGSLINTKTIELDSVSNHVTGTLSVLGKIKEPIGIDTKGLVNPSIVTIQDSTVKTDIIIDNIIGTVPNPLNFDLSYGAPQSVQIPVTVTTKTIDNRPSVAFGASKIYAFNNSVGITQVTVRIPFTINNSKSTNAVDMSVVANYLEGNFVNNYHVAGGNLLEGVIEFTFNTNGPELLNSRGLVTADAGSYHTERVIGTTIDPLTIISNASQIPPLKPSTPQTITPSGPVDTTVPNPLSNGSSGSGIPLPLIGGIALAVGVGFVAIMASGKKSRKKITV